MAKYDLLSRLRHKYHMGIAGLVSTATITAVVITASIGTKIYNRILKNNFFERAAAGYFIASDKSLDKISLQTNGIESMVKALNRAGEDINCMHTRAAIDLEEKIRVAPDPNKAAEILLLHNELENIHQKYSDYRSQLSQKLEELTKVKEKIDSYSTIWRRTAKIKTFVIYEFVDYAHYKAEKLKQNQGLVGKVSRGLESFYNKYNETVHDITPEEYDKRYENLRQQIKSYMTSEFAKQGIGNLLENLNRKIDDNALSTGMKQTYELIRDAITQTNDLQIGIEILDFLQYGTRPNSLENATTSFLGCQKEAHDLINNTYMLVMDLTGIVERSENIGIKLEKMELDKLAGYTTQLMQIELDLKNTQAEMNKTGIDPLDPQYIGLIGRLKIMYGAAFGLICMTEVGIGYLIARNSLQKNRYYRLQKEYDALKEGIENA